MNIIIFSLTILGCWVIIRIALKAWNKANMRNRMEKIEEVDKDYNKVLNFKKTHKGKTDKKQVIDDFVNKE